MIEPVLYSEHLHEQTTLFYRVRRYIETFAKIWRQSSSEWSEPGQKIGYMEKKRRERHLKTFLRKVRPTRSTQSSFFSESEHENKIFRHVQQFLVNGISMNPYQLDLLMSDDFKNSTIEFVTMTRKFDSSLSPADIFQACRNVWIMNGLQLLLGIKVEFTPAIFAYSLLYPYTDNYLDDIAIPAAEKKSFNKRFEDRLNGLAVLPKNSHEKIIFALVEMIEGQYNRALYPQVFESLVAIQQAQAKSVSLIQRIHPLSNKDILDISLDKGGTSVLADGYLVAGSLTEEQERFLFGYGAYLQLLDDLQDVQDDAAVGQKTIYSIFSPLIDLDALANKTFAFGGSVLALYEKSTNEAANAYVDIIQKSVRLMLIEAICFAKEDFSPKYLSILEKQSPFRFKILRDLKKRHQPYYMSMFGKVI
jgi:hypothetical protein